jgi:hypothetical protein
MDTSLTSLSIIKSAFVLLLVCLCCLPAVTSIVCLCTQKRPRKDQQTKEGYQDEDGEATASSLQAFSYQWQRIGIVLASVLGLSIALGLAALTTWRLPQPLCFHTWFQVGIWVSYQPIRAKE